ncbi:Amidinotransferase [Plasmodiophora brassicae]
MSIDSIMAAAPSDAAVCDRDAIVSDRVTFLQSGAKSRVASWLSIMDTMRGSFPTHTVAIVHNALDLDTSRACLRDAFFVDGNVAVFLRVALLPNCRRFVDEYQWSGDRWLLTRHDIDLFSYVSGSTLRCVSVDSMDKVNSRRQTTSKILMVAPDGFAYNPHAAVDNKFSHEVDKSSDDVREAARAEFASLHAALERCGVQIVLIANPEFHDTPDAVFPNNWFSTHSKSEVGRDTLALYPMKPVSRRAERRAEIIARIQAVHSYDNLVDLRKFEEGSAPQFLEGTGSMVLDRVNRVCYVCLSERSTLPLATQWCSTMGYNLHAFHATDASGSPVYHTNVMMAVGSRFAVVCDQAVDDQHERARLLDQLRTTGHEVICISRAQMADFCGNILELSNAFGQSVLVASTRAWKAFGEEIRTRFGKLVDEVVHADIPTIESVGGGGVRCMIAELF